MNAIPWTERELRRLIAKACGALFEKNLVAATDGNVSARLGPDRVLVTPSGISKGDVRELDILLCDMEGRKIRGRGEISSEIHVHLAAYRAREDIGAVVHAHPPVASAFTYAGLEHLFREPLLPEVVAQIGPIPAAPYITPGTRALAEAFAAHVRACDIVLLSQHGAVAVGKDPWAAYLRMEKLEQFAVILKAARELAAGQDLRTLNPEQVAELKAGYGMSALKTGREVDACSPGRAKAKLEAPAAALDNAEDPTLLIERIANEVLRRLGVAG